MEPIVVLFLGQGDCFLKTVQPYKYLTKPLGDAMFTIWRLGPVFTTFFVILSYLFKLLVPRFPFL